ncbi:MAG: M81 family metallopeptidase [Casimicrobiaceae bacterium]
MPDVSAGPRIALGSFMLESNAHAPVATREEFAQNVLLEPGAVLADLRSAHPQAPGCLAGFFLEIERIAATPSAFGRQGDAPAARVAGAPARWQPVPLIVAAVGASGPIDQPWFDTIVASMVASLKAALAEGPLDGVFLSLHGAAIATVEADPDGVLLAAVRGVVGDRVPVAATLDLHGNVSAAMVQHADYLAAYLTNPHVDTHERGAECARALVRMMATGARPHRAFVKLPFIPPSVTQNTKAGPYGDVIAFGQSRVGGDVENVSVLSGFTLGDTPKAGMSIIVAARTADAARETARAVATRAWDDRARYVPRLTSLDAATRMAVAAGADLTLPPLLFADVADNAGGGGRGNTVWILEAFHRAGVAGCTLGIFYEPAVAAQAHAAGVGTQLHVQFNAQETHPLSGRFAATGRVMQLHDGHFIGRRGIAAGHAVALGPCARLRCGGIDVIVVSVRQQAKDPVFFEALGVDIAAQRCVVVKSRGHFRAAFDEFFPDERIVEVDVPGLTTPVLKSVPYRYIPRPLYPLDDDWGYTVGEPQVFEARRS